MAHLLDGLPASAIAIVGLAARVPGAQDHREFWHNVRQAANAGTVLADVDQFDAGLFGFARPEADVLDPQTRLFLECSWSAIEDSGYDIGRFRGKIGVFGGAARSTYPGGHEQLASAVSYSLELEGPSIGVQTGDSTSLTAVHLACQSLCSGECDLALAGAVSLRMADGAALGNGGPPLSSGAGVVALRRVEDAIESGDHSYAIIRGSAVNNDGARPGYMTPRAYGRTAVMRQALARAEVTPTDISYLESGGAASQVHEAAEVTALREIYGDYGGSAFFALGSLTFNTGYLGEASGIVALIKVAMALAGKEIAPGPDTGLVAELASDPGPFYVTRKPCAWVTQGRTARCAGVSSFGVGGANAYAVLEESPQRHCDDPSAGMRLLVLSARSAAALDAGAGNLLRYLRSNPSTQLADVAYTLQVGRRTFSHRRVISARTVPDAVVALADAPATSDPGLPHVRRSRRVVFMFPGVGAQHVGMGRDLYHEETDFRTCVDRCADLLLPELGADIREVLLRPQERLPVGSDLDLRMLMRGKAPTASFRQTDVVHPALFVTQFALAQQLIAWGIRPVGVIGHSLGEYVAACVAGMLSIEDALRLVAARSRLIAALPRGSMLAVALGPGDVQDYLSAEVDLAAVNSRTACVLSGSAQRIDELSAELARQGIAACLVDAEHAFHSSQMKPAAMELERLARGTQFRVPAIPCISTLTGTWFTAEDATDPAYWRRHLCGTIHFDEGIGELLGGSDHVLLEVGHGASLSSFARQHPRCTRDCAERVIALLPGYPSSEPEHDLAMLALGRLWMVGVPISWESMYAGQRRLRIPLPTYPFERQRHWVEEDAE